MSNQGQWHQLDTSVVLERLGTDATTGLSEAEVARRLTEYGPNELAYRGEVSVWSILLDQFKSALILILLVAILLSVFLGQTIEALAIGVIVTFAALLGFVQEYRAGRALEALKRLAAPTAEVLRGEERDHVPAGQLVPGDIVYLHTGDRIPADGRLIESRNLQVNEAALTGESLPVEKQTSPLEGENRAVADRTNMAYSGTDVTYGRGQIVVTGTGMQTEFGRIAGFLEGVEETRTPLQENLDRVGGVLARAALVIVLVIAGTGLARGLPLLEMFVFGIALAVAVVPEALPAVVTISLSIGVQRMAKRNSLVRHLPAVETLGSVSVICSDKTGTLTRDEMTVRKILVGGRTVTVSGAGYEPSGTFASDGVQIEPSGGLLTLLTGAALASDARLVKVPPTGWQIQGDPTEGALVVAAVKAGLPASDLEARAPRIQEIPFSSESKRMTTLHDGPDGIVAYAKGAPEIILESCSQVLTDGVSRPLGPDERKSLLDSGHQMAGQALRVLAVAFKSGATPENAERDMVFLGLLGMIDPPRSEAKVSIDTCLRAGITPIMITGDHPSTAAAVARELGLLGHGEVVTGAELDAMDEPSLERQVSEISVFARVSPAHKMRIVEVLQKQGHCVAMTGDGINDAPALKKADIGIAMGITGTDVTREAADITLTDDNFASIVAAVEEGRGIFDNIKKYLMFLLSSNLGEITLLGAAVLLAWPLPLTAVQILYVNLATDGLPALALAIDPPERGLMHRRPRDPRRGIFSRPVVTLMLVGGFWSAAVNLGLFNWALGSGREIEEAMTMVLASLVLIEFFKAYNYRSDRRSVLIRPFANRWLNLAILWELVLLLLVVNLPVFQAALGTRGVALGDWLIVLAVALTIFPVLELAKWLGRRGWYGSMD